MLVLKDTWLSNLLGGWTLFNFSHRELSGMISMLSVIIVQTSIGFEMMFSICLNLDVVWTIRYPFNRKDYLGRLVRSIRIGVIILMIICLYGIYVVL
jgi:hypothetical protein